MQGIILTNAVGWIKELIVKFKAMEDMPISISVRRIENARFENAKLEKNTSRVSK